MRIISGKYRGRRVTAPKSIKARPTTDFAKESLFNILVHKFDLEAVKVLDVFSGTGNIAFEFASRGAQHVTAVDITQISKRFISQQAQEMDLNITVRRADGFRFLRGAADKFDIIFADPPYILKNIHEIPKAVFENQLLNEGGILVVEHDKNTNLSTVENFRESRSYGKAIFSFFEY